MVLKKQRGGFMALVKIKKHHQITLPINLRKKFKLTVGDYIEVDDQSGEIVMKPVKVIHPDQEYFYTKEWQKDEADADKDIKEGKLIGPFDNVDDCIKDLES
jgi:AbrB family looped-hinge helix DNA binding protein